MTRGQDQEREKWVKTRWTGGPGSVCRGGGAAKKVALELSQRDSCEWHPGPSLVRVRKMSRLQSTLA